jgi:hypothetical protein
LLIDTRTKSIQRERIESSAGHIRMTSDQQIEANRANARRSTGPKTADGKARSRRNSWKHGLTAEVIVLRDEEADDFSELREALMEQYDPQSAMECELVERMAGILWRLRRLPTYEAAALDFRVEQAAFRKNEWEWDENIMLTEDGEPKGGEPNEGEDLLAQSIRLGQALTTDMSYSNSLQKLGRHETSLMGALIKTQEMLADLQSSRGASAAA